MSTIRVLLADDHGVLRAGLRALLESQADTEVVGMADTADEAVRLAAELQPDLALVDVRMPGGGLAAVRRMKQAAPELQGAHPEAVPRCALPSGGAGRGRLRLRPQAGRRAGAPAGHPGGGPWGVYLHPAIARLLVEDAWGPREPLTSLARPLSERETQVLRLVALGHTTQQVAERLFLSVRTVETYKARGMEKLGLRGRAALVRYALEHGLLDAESEALPGDT